MVYMNLSRGTDPTMVKNQPAEPHVVEAVDCKNYGRRFSEFARKRLGYAVAVALIIPFAVHFLGGSNQCLAYVKVGYSSTLAFIQAAHPAVFWVALTLLPLVGFPAAPLLIAVGVRFPTHQAFLIAASSILANLLLSHLVGSLFLHSLLTKLLKKLGHHVPQIPEPMHKRMTLLLRVTPGIPVFIGNYLLVLGGVRLADFVLISFPIQMAFAAGFILLGGSLVGGNLRWAVLAIALVLAFKLVIQARTAKSKMPQTAPIVGNADV